MKLLLSLSFVFFLISQLFLSAVLGRVIVPTLQDGSGAIPKTDSTVLSHAFHGRKFAVHIKKYFRGSPTGVGGYTPSTPQVNYHKKSSAAFRVPLSSLYSYFAFGSFFFLCLLWSAAHKVERKPYFSDLVLTGTQFWGWSRSNSIVIFSCSHQDLILKVLMFLVIHSCISQYHFFPHQRKQD